MLLMHWAIICWAWSVYQISVKLSKNGFYNTWTSCNTKADPDCFFTYSTSPFSWNRLSSSTLKYKQMNKAGQEQKGSFLARLVPFHEQLYLLSLFGCVWWPRNANHPTGRKHKLLSYFCTTEMIVWW